MNKKRFHYKIVFITLFLIAVSSHGFARSLLWRDEFDGTSLDTTKWTVVNAEDWYDCWYAPHNVEVSEGTLKLHSREQLYNGKHWTGAKLEGKYHPQYKYLEAKIRHSLPDSHIWSAWWTIGWTGTTWQWPPEFDIFEFAIQWETTPFQTYHWDRGYGHEMDGEITGLDETEWHTYGVYWTAAQSAVFYVDGVRSYQPYGPAESAQMQALLILSSSPNRDDHYSGCSLGDFEVDYVRVYDSPPDHDMSVTNLALNKPVQVSSSQSGHDGSYAVDGDAGTRWASDWSDPQFIVVDLGQETPFSIVRLNWENAYASRFLIQVSNDNSTWTTVVNEQNGSVGIREYSVDANARYLKILGTERGTEWGYSLYEVQIYQCRKYDLAFFDSMAYNWLETDCGSNNCEGADMDFDNDVDIIDLQELAFQWLGLNCFGNS